MIFFRTIFSARIALFAAVAVGFVLISESVRDTVLRRQAELEGLDEDLIVTGSVDPPTENNLGVAALQPNERAATPRHAANPLWNIPLSALSATRERPLFLPSRRSPPGAGGPPQTLLQATNRPPAPTLIGAIASGSEGFAILLDDSTKALVRVKIGETLMGWTLLSVTGREAIMQYGGQETATLVLPGPSAK